MKTSSLVMAPVPQLQTGNNKISLLPEMIKSFGNRVLLAHGATSLQSSGVLERLSGELESHGIACEYAIISGEPSPQMVDDIVMRQSSHKPDVVAGIGGGSVLDAAKAIAAMIPLGEPVKSYLEGVGNKVHPGVTLPFIAVPTTSGTGSETTRNAVLSDVGEQGYKKSLRHMNFVSNATILDPQLMVSCPPEVTASSGNDAFTQLLESYLSIAATPLSDHLALEGLKLVAHALPKAFKDPEDTEARADMALAAYISGITLTNVGLGLVHGLAGIIGGHRAIPHGVICSALMPATNEVTLRKLRDKASWHNAINKYATVGKLFTVSTNKPEAYYADLLIDTIYEWNSTMKIPRLAAYGLNAHELSVFASIGENKNHPIPLNEEEITEILKRSFW